MFVGAGNLPEGAADALSLALSDVAAAVAQSHPVEYAAARAIQGRPGWVPRWQRGVRGGSADRGGTTTIRTPTGGVV